MTLPHQCRCVICGEIGVITPEALTIMGTLPNIYAEARTIRGNVPDVPPGGVERRAVGMVPELSSPYASSRADELAPREPPPAYAEVATCTHGYTRCMICKFPAP